LITGDKHGLLVVSDIENFKPICTFDLKTLAQDKACNLWIRSLAMSLDGLRLLIGT